jgi:hypothetical protein
VHIGGVVQAPAGTAQGAFTEQPETPFGSLMIHTVTVSPLRRRRQPDIRRHAPGTGGSASPEAVVFARYFAP